MVFKVPFGTLRGEPKQKFCILVCVDPRLRVFLISSQPHPRAKSNPRIRQEMVQIDCKHHDFLNHDSYVDCGEAFGEYTSEQLQAYVQQNPKAYIGTLADAMIGRIIQATENSVRLEILKRNEIVFALKSTYPYCFEGHEDQ